LYSGGMGDHAQATLDITDLELDSYDQLKVIIGFKMFRRADEGELSSELSIEMGGTKFSVAALTVDEYCTDDCGHQFYESAQAQILIDKSMDELVVCMKDDDVSDHFELTNGSFGSMLKVESYPVPSRNSADEFLPNATIINYIRIYSYK